MNINTPVPGIYDYFKEKYGEIWNHQLESLQAEFSSAIEKVLKPGQDLTDLPILYVKKEAAHGLLQTLKEKYNYSFLTDFTFSM